MILMMMTMTILMMILMMRIDILSDKMINNCGNPPSAK